jgi:hypothetical protein
MSTDKNAFYNRADNIIAYANSQITENENPGDVSASFMFAASRFNAWAASCTFDNVEDMKKGKDEMMEYFIEDYKKMLEENLDNYIDNFDQQVK